MSADSNDPEPILNLLRSHRFRFYLLVTSLLAVVGWGVYAFYLTYVYGLGLTGDRLPVSWGLNIVDFVFFIAISMAGTIISGVLRLSNAAWRKPITRIAESITIAALPIGALFPLLDLGNPQRVGNLLAFARLQSPITWDTIAIGTYLVASLIYFYLPLIPDLAICRDALSGISRLRRWLYSALSLGWAGRTDQQDRLKSSIKIMAVLIVPIAVTVHSVLAWVFSVTLRVEMHSTVFPIFFVVGAVYSGMAMILIVLCAFRRFYHLERYIEVKHVLYLAYVFLVADLTMIYLTVTEYLTPAWTAETADVQYLSSLLTGAYSPYFWFMIVGGFLVPAFIVAFPRTRNARFIVLAASLAVAGMWVERYLIIIPSLAVPVLPYQPGVFAPSWEDLSVTAAGFAGFALLLVVLSKLFPIISLWELREGEGSTSSAVPSSIASLPSLSSDNQEAGRAGRRDFLKTGLFATVGMGLGFATPLVVLPGSRSPQDGNAGGQAFVQMSSLGDPVSTQQARSAASFSVSVPTYLPAGTALKETRITADRGMVALLYGSASLQPLPYYEDKVGVAVFQRKEGVVDGPPSFLPKGFDRIAVQGNPGFLREPQGSDGEPGQIQWWSGGRRISIFANLNGSELAKIASSMEASLNA